MEDIPRRKGFSVFKFRLRHAESSCEHKINMGNQMVKIKIIRNQTEKHLHYKVEVKEKKQETKCLFLQEKYETSK